MRTYTRRTVLKWGTGAVGALLAGRAPRGNARANHLARKTADGRAAPQQADLFAVGELLTRPTDRAVSVSVVPAADVEAYVEYTDPAGVFSRRTPPVSLTGGQPATIGVENLAPASRSLYRLRFREPGAPDFLAGPERHVQTQRAAGSAFRFAIQADSHLGTAKHCDPALYSRTLANIAADEPDFLIDLGDTFRTTKLKEVRRETIDRLYLEQRRYLGLIGHSVPVFLVNGNHEMGWGWLLDGTAESVPAMCASARNTYFPQPQPDAFYTGDEELIPGIGLARDYYAWEWGDALFVVIDPYWHTPTDPGGAGNDKVTGDDTPKDPWAWTLGNTQYRWLTRTLTDSPARYKFVFEHHVLGTCRGGIEWADYYEWGGRDRNGADTFAAHRPGWETPIHPLMAKHGVTIFFQGHDHVFARQERDGVVYQTVPMPADPTYTAYNSDAFHSGDIRPNSGHLRVSVAPEGVRVDYVRAFLPADEMEGRVNGQLAFSYTVGTPERMATPPTPPVTQSPATTPTPTTAPTTTPTTAPTPEPAARSIYLPRVRR